MENHPKNSYTAQEKMAILKRHLVEKKTVPDLCDEYHLHPTVFYRWLKTFFENGAAAFGPPPRAEKQVAACEQRIAFLEAKLKRKDEVHEARTWRWRRGHNYGSELLTTNISGLQPPQSRRKRREVGGALDRYSPTGSFNPSLNQRQRAIIKDALDTFSALPRYRLQSNVPHGTGEYSGRPHPD